jgi:hypothetical protein
MDTATIAFITASTALVAGVAGPVVSLVVARQQTRASVISHNRERWAETLRDLVAEYVALLLSAAHMRQALPPDISAALRADHALLTHVERVALTKNKILLIINPVKSDHGELSRTIDAAYLALSSESPPPLGEMRLDVDAITRAGRAVLRAEWQRVKRGE